MKLGKTERAIVRLLAGADPDRPSPTFREMGAVIGVSASMAHQAFTSLEAKGLAFNKPWRRRTHRVREGALSIAEECAP